MEQKINTAILKTIGKVFERSKGCKLKPEHFKTLDKELSLLSDYLKVSKTQAFFIAMVFTLSYQGYKTDMKELIEYFNCNPVKLLEFNDDLEILYKNRIFIKNHTRRRNGERIQNLNECFTINEKIARAIIKREPLPSMYNLGYNDVAEVLEEVYNNGLQSYDNEIPAYELHSRVE